MNLYGAKPRRSLRSEVPGRRWAALILADLRTRISRTDIASAKKMFAEHGGTPIIANRSSRWARLCLIPRPASKRISRGLHRIRCRYLSGRLTSRRCRMTRLRLDWQRRSPRSVPMMATSNFPSDYCAGRWPDEVYRAQAGGKHRYLDPGSPPRKGKGDISCIHNCISCITAWRR